MAKVITRHKAKYEISNIKTDTVLLIKILVVTAIPVLLILQQPDFGTSMVYLFIAGMMIILFRNQLENNYELDCNYFSWYCCCFNLYYQIS